MKSLDVGSRHRIQNLKEAHAIGLQPTKDCTITEKMIDSIQLILLFQILASDLISNCLLKT